jgi:hypothetical protein
MRGDGSVAGRLHKPSEVVGDRAVHQQVRSNRL